MRAPRFSASWILAAVLALPAAQAGAICPDSLCDCLGSAKDFGTVSAVSLKVKYGQIKVSGYPERFPALVDVDSCATAAQSTGTNDGASGVEFETLTALMPGPKGPKFRTKMLYGYYDLIGTIVHGDVATTGGPIDGPQYVTVEGAVDTSGSHSSIAPCQQAITDMGTAATTLAGLPPTQTLGDVTVKGGQDTPYTITAGPGLNVIKFGKLQVKPLNVDGYPEGSLVDIQTDSATSALIIVVDKLVVGNQCEVTLSDPGASGKVIMVANGAGARVPIGNEAIVEPAVLAPQRVITTGGDAQVPNLYGSQVLVKGSTVEDALGCSP